MEGCIFCKIIEGEVPCSKIYEDDDVIAFLDVSPINKGHTLVVPKKHCENIFDIDGETLEKVVGAVKRVAEGVKKGVNADGVVVSQNNGKAAGQVVMHLHFHVIPRFKEDELKGWPRGRYKDGEMAQYAERINSFL